MDEDMYFINDSLSVGSKPSPAVKPVKSTPTVYKLVSQSEIDSGKIVINKPMPNSNGKNLPDYHLSYLFW
jgi:hypothetical protein